MKRRVGPRYSLGGLLATILLIGLSLAWVRRQIDQRNALSESLIGVPGVIVIGGREAHPWFVRYFKPVRGVDLTQITGLDMGGDLVDDKTLLIFQELPYLERVTIGYSKVTDEGLLSLAKHKHLKEVSVTRERFSRITAEGIKRFRAARPDVSVVELPR